MFISFFGGNKTLNFLIIHAGLLQNGSSIIVIEQLLVRNDDTLCATGLFI
jgi:hypothetical protein